MNTWVAIGWGWTVCGIINGFGLGCVLLAEMLVDEDEIPDDGLPITVGDVLIVFCLYVLLWPVSLVHFLLHRDA